GVEGAAILPRRDADRDRLQGAGVERIAVRRVGEARELELVAVDTAGAEARHENATAAERDLAGRPAVAVCTAVGVGDVLRPAQPLAIVFHHRAQHLLAGLEAETEERGARVGEHVEQRQWELDRGDRRGCERFPGGRSCATLLHGGSFRMVVVTAVLPWTAEGAAAPSSARQFNRRRDIPYAGDNLDLAAEADVAGSRNLALAQFPQACKIALRVVVEQERRTGVCPPGVGGGVTSSLRYCGRGHGRSGRSVRPGPVVSFASDLSRVVTGQRSTSRRPLLP